MVHWEQIVVSLARRSRCVSLSHRTLLALCTAEEAPQHTEAVHHHQSLHTLWVCMCVLTLSRSRKLMSNKQTHCSNNRARPSPPLFPNKPGTSLAFFLFAFKWAVCISDAAHSLANCQSLTTPRYNFTPQNTSWKKIKLPDRKIDFFECFVEIL